MKTRMMSFLVVAVIVAGGLLAAAMLLSGCEEGDKPAPKGAPKGGTAAPVVNATCPIMGNKLDRANVPAGLTREFQGKKVGFCCGGCPDAWDKLTDARKAAKLAAAMPPAPK